MNKTGRALLVITDKNGNPIYFHKSTFPEIRFKPQKGEKYSKEFKENIEAFVISYLMKAELNRKIKDAEGNSSSSDGQG